MSAAILTLPTLTADQAAAFLKLRPETVLDLAEDDALPGRKAGGVWFFDRWELVEWLGDPEEWGDCQDDQPLPPRPKLRLVPI